MQGIAGEERMNSQVTYGLRHMDVPVFAKQKRLTSALSEHSIEPRSPTMIERERAR